MEAAADAKKAAVITTATAHARKPWAVSRKYTSSEWMETHFVRSRPARYPPIAEAINCIMITHTMAAVPIAEADAPVFVQGEMDDKPKPVPREIRISDSA